MYSPEGARLTADNVDSAYGTPAWEHYGMQLGNEAATFTKVPGISSGIPYSDGQPLTVGGTQVRHEKSHVALRGSMGRFTLC